MVLLSDADIKKFDDLSRMFDERQKLNRVKYAAFAIPVKDGVIYLATRNTPPFKGFYSAVGGKVDESAECLGFGNPTASSIRLGELGFERPTTAAVREFCEEMYFGRKFPDGFDLDKFEAAKLFCINDSVTGVSCYIRLVSVPSELYFTPSPREIGRVDRLVDIDPTQINPLTKVALVGMAKERSCSDFHDQLPPLDKLVVDYFGPIWDHYLLSY